MVKITLTLCFAFPNGSEKPSISEIANFVKSLDANPNEMEATYRIAEEKSIFIKFKSEASLQHTLIHNTEQLPFHYSNGKIVDVRMSLAGGNVQYVRVYDLPPEVPDNDLLLVLNKYGKVKRVVREKFPVELGLDMHTGVRGVFMDVEKEIPTSLSFLIRKGNIFYAGNKDKCFLCKEDGHHMNSCPKRKTRKQAGSQHLDKQRIQNTEKPEKNEEQSDISSYADIVVGGSPTGVIEVLEEEMMPTEEETQETQDRKHVQHEEQSGSQVQKRLAADYEKDPTYLTAIKLFNQQKKKEVNSGEKKILRARVKASSKLSSSRIK